VFTVQRVRSNIIKKRAFVYVCREYLQVACSDIKEVFGNVSFAAIIKHYKQSYGDVSRKEGCWKETVRIKNILK